MWLKRFVATALILGTCGNIGIIIAGMGFGVGRPSDTANIQTAVSENTASTGADPTGALASPDPVANRQSDNGETGDVVNQPGTNNASTSSGSTSSSSSSPSPQPNPSPNPNPSPSPSPNPSPNPNPSPTPPPPPSPPVISFSASPAVITAGSSSNLSWSTTGNGTTCSASGNWSGAKPASGSQTVAPSSSSSYTLTCSNSGGIRSQTVSVTVNSATQYCSSNTPCYGQTDMANHSSSSNCWGYNINIVYNLNAFAPVHPGGASNIGGPECGHDLSGYLSGSKSYNGSHSHQTATRNNQNSLLLQYKVGYYDPNKP